jgi:enoyl-CoA hydratase/carnithine racemase
MPTVALINGHCFAGGLLTAMMHDYRIMNPHKGFLCMNEVDFGAPLMPPMSSIFRQKLRADTYRNMVLEAKRFNALAALKEGIVDGLGAWPETLKYIEEMQLTKKGETGVYGRLKEEMWRETITYLDNGGAKEEEDVGRRMGATEDLVQKAEKRVEEFYKTKAKL